MTLSARTDIARRSRSKRHQCSAGLRSAQVRGSSRSGRDLSFVSIDAPLLIAQPAHAVK